ncbi:MAG: hypothetical protein IPK82_23480 [Polyangiaceae bacterium]|nr:hypothetical protein [Polyangiaceae bacterium]
MKPLALTLGLAGLAVMVFGSYELACGFMILGIVFALEALTSPRADTLGEERPETRQPSFIIHHSPEEVARVWTELAERNTQNTQTPIPKGRSYEHVHPCLVHLLGTAVHPRDLQSRARVRETQHVRFRFHHPVQQLPPVRPFRRQPEARQ